MNDNDKFLAELLKNNPPIDLANPGSIDGYNIVQVNGKSVLVVARTSDAPPSSILSDEERAALLDALDYPDTQNHVGHLGDPRYMQPGETFEDLLRRRPTATSHKVKSPTLSAALVDAMSMGVLAAGLHPTIAKRPDLVNDLLQRPALASQRRRRNREKVTKGKCHTCHKAHRNCRCR